MSQKHLQLTRCVAARTAFKKISRSAKPEEEQQVFDIAKREWKSDVEHHRQADDLRRCFEIAKWARFRHYQTLRNRHARFNPVSSDSAGLRVGDAVIDVKQQSANSSVEVIRLAEEVSGKLLLQIVRNGQILFIATG